MTYAVLSSKAPVGCIDALREAGFTPLVLPPFERLQSPVDTHADMLLFSYKNEMIVEEEYYKTAKDIFDTLARDCALTLTLARDNVNKEYPHDVALNAVCLSDAVFSKSKYTSKKISELAEARQLRMLNVNQGYAACSTLVLSDRAVICADPSLTAEYEKNGIDVCRISNGSVSLPPYDCGFIGGACGVYGESVYFAGNIDLHSDADKIKSVIASLKMKCVSLSQEPLCDVGGIKFFESQSID